jgi:hypothetical protein
MQVLTELLNILSLGLSGGSRSPDVGLIIAVQFWLIVVLVIVVQSGGLVMLAKYIKGEGMAPGAYYVKGAFSGQQQVRGTGLQGFTPNAAHVSANKLMEVAKENTGF